MIQLDNTVPTTEAKHALPLLRTPAKGQLRILVTCNQIIGTYTHWYAGRTQPCRGDSCKACLEGTPSRWMGYLSGRAADPAKHALVELPRLAAEQIYAWQQQYGTLRGKVITLARLSKRSNGRVCAQIEDDPNPDRTLPDAPDLLRCLATIWQVKLAEFEVGKTTHAGPDVQVHQHAPKHDNDPTHIAEILGPTQLEKKLWPASSPKASSNSSASGSKATSEP